MSIDPLPPADPNRSWWPRAREQRAVLLLILTYWLLFQLVFAGYRLASSPSQPLSIAAWARSLPYYFTTPSELAICGIGVLCSYLIFIALRLVHGRALAVRLLVSLALTLAGAVAFAIAIVVVDSTPTVPAEAARTILRLTITWFSPIGIWTAAALALDYAREVADRERRIAAARDEAREAQVRALRFQLNPHFLYNTLNAIAALILDRRGDEAEAMVRRLSDFLRATLALDPLVELPLGQEIALQRLYLEIERARFADSLIVTIDVPPALEAVHVPCLILQPLVENAIKHGMPHDGAPLRLTIGASTANGMLRLRVVDNGPGMRTASSMRLDEGAGIGIANVRERLALRHGAAGRIEIDDKSEGFVISILLPLEEVAR